MIREREQRAEPLNPDSWVFRSTSHRLDQQVIRKVQLSTPGSPLSQSQIGTIVRQVAIKRGLQQQFGKRYLFHPHGFRRYWKHQWTIQDIKDQYRRTETYINLQSKQSVSKEEIQTEILNIFLGKMRQEDVVSLSHNLGVSVAQIQHILKGFYNNKT
jgi:hypothetical protein